MNRGKKRGKSMAGSFILALLTFLLTVHPVWAEENRMPELIPGEKGVLQVTLTCMDEEEKEITLPGVSIGIYQVAELNVQGGSAEYDRLEHFAGVELSFEGMTASSSNEAALVLSDWIEKQDVTGTVLTTDSEGTVVFENLEPGIYLVRQESYQDMESEYLEMAPYLAMVPGMVEYNSEKSWNYGVTTVPKVSIQEKNEPQTGRIEVTKRVTQKTEDGAEEILAADETFYVGLFSDPEGKQLYDNAYIRPIHLTNASSATVVFENLPYGEYYLFETDVAGKALPTDVAIESGDLLYICLFEGDGEQKAVLDSETPEVQKLINNCYVELPGDGYNESETGTESETEETELSEESEIWPDQTEGAVGDSVKTGDDTNLGGYLIIMLLAAGYLLLAFRRKSG